MLVRPLRPGPPWQSKRRRTQSQHFEVNSDFEKDLALAIRLSAAEAQSSPPAASRAEDAEQSATHAQQQEDARNGDQACALGRQADVAQRAPSHAEDSCAEGERNPDGAAAKVSAATFAARSKSAMTPAVVTSDAISARDTKKKRSRFANSDEESDQEHAAPALHASPEPARNHEQVPKSSKRKTIEDSDEDEIQQPADAAEPSFSASKSGRGKGPEFKVVEYQTGSEESVAIRGANRGLESDMVPDSEDECAEDVRCAAGEECQLFVAFSGYIGGKSTFAAFVTCKRRQKLARVL